MEHEVCNKRTTISKPKRKNNEIESSAKEGRQSKMIQKGKKFK